VHQDFAQQHKLYGMYNPFPLINEQILKDKIQGGKKYFVRQTYRRGKQGQVASFLFRAYEENEIEIAEKHMSVLANDGNAFLYNASDPKHFEKLMIAAKQPAGYSIFYAGKKGIEWKPPAKYQQKMKQYIQNNHPGWRTKKGGDKIEIGLHEELGRLFLKFSFEGDEDKIPLEQIENL
jgi:hypothetical protein